MDNTSSIEHNQEEVTELLWSNPESQFDISSIRPHNCMVDIVQRGNYIHCNEGNHGMRIPAGKILNKRDGEWVLDNIVVLMSKMI